MCALPVQDTYRQPPHYGRLLAVESRVPCAGLINAWLTFHDTAFDQLVSSSRRFESQFLAWETVRKTRNPFFVEGTGFEGYFVGQDKTPEEVIGLLLQIGRDSLASNDRVYHHEPHFRTNLMLTLTGEIEDDRAVDVWATELGAILGRLREHVYTNRVANQFQTETYHAVSNLPAITYTRTDHQIKQSYVLPVYPESEFSRVDWRLEYVRPEDYDAALVVWSIGRFGHPLLRECLRESGTWAP